jgi:hypothetical protein
VPLRLNGPRHVKIVAALLAILGSFSLLAGCLAGGALGRDVPTDGTWRQVAMGPWLIVAGVMALDAGVRNQRFESRARGVLALLVMGAFGFVYGRLVNPFNVVALYGLLVYLSPAGRDAFRVTVWKRADGTEVLLRKDEPEAKGLDTQK